MKLVFLGTSCSTPTKARNLSAMALWYDGEWFLFDCPEGTQRQIMQSSVSYMKIQRLFLSHFHADHTLGLPGLVATMSMHERDHPLFIYGPRGVQEKVRQLIEVAGMNLTFEIVCKEARKGIILEGKSFEVSAFPLKHDVPCFGYVFKEKDKAGEFVKAKAKALGVPEGPLYSKLQNGESIKLDGKTIKPEQVMDYSKGRKGKKVAFVADTLYSDSYFDAIAEADVLVHEASFLESMAARAKETRHCTAKQAAIAAEKTRAKRLVLTHVSPRHKSSEELEIEARQEFGNVIVAKDLLEIEV